MSFDRFKGAGTFVSGQVKTPDGKNHEIPNESQSYPVPQFACTVSAGALLKYNMNVKDPKTNSFQGVAIQVSAGITLACSPETADITYAKCQEWVANKVLESRSHYVSRFQLQDWFGN